MRFHSIFPILVAAALGLAPSQGVTPLAPAAQAPPPDRIADFDRPRYFGYYTGEARVSESQYYDDGVYPVDVAVAETPTGIVGLLNITFDPFDSLSGTFTHTFSGRPTRDGHVVFKYADRMCAAANPHGKCTPQYTVKGHVQYSFEGEAVFSRRSLSLVRPEIIPHLPYEPDLPFDLITVERAESPRRTSFDGFYPNLQLVSMPSVIFPLPLFLFGSNQVTIQHGEIVEWIDSSGFPFPLEWFLGACFDYTRGRGWMNQQGWWYYHWNLDPDGRGVNVIVTSWDPGLVANCAAVGDVLAGDGLDLVHLKLAAIMFEL